MAEKLRAPASAAAVPGVSGAVDARPEKYAWCRPWWLPL